MAESLRDFYRSHEVAPLFLIHHSSFIIHDFLRHPFGLLFLGRAIDSGLGLLSFKFYNLTMRAEIISIGTEILLGSILNTNARFLSQQLSQNAIDVYRQNVVGDNVERIAESFQSALHRSDMVISSGGLGPTEDDATVRGLALFLNKPLVFHRPTYRAIQKRLSKRGYRMTKLIAKQCYVPKGYKNIFQNLNGTAPGILCEVVINRKTKQVLLLPGPPAELEPMFLNQFLPRLRSLIDKPSQTFITRSVRLADVPESQVAQKITDLLRWKPPLTVGIYAKPQEVEIKIMAKASSAHTAQKMILRTERILRQRLGEKIYGIDNETLSSSVGKLLIQKRKKVATAESCTGGLLGHLFTETAGSSSYYLGGVTAYQNAFKVSFLDVPEAILKKYGAVSTQTAKKMSEGVKRRFQADIGIGITGIAGPGGKTSNKRVGLVFIALSIGGKTAVSKNLFLGSRADIKMKAAKKALNLLRLRLLAGK